MRPLVLSLALVAAVFAVFAGALRADFAFDDFEFLVDHPVISRGLTLEGIAWVFTHSAGTYWIPLTNVSHMLDFTLFGADARGHHLTSLVFHAANAVLLFLVLASLTGGTWRSFAVAALFALHPLHVESVAWVAERKDVLSTFFWFLSLAAYLRYVRRPGRGRYVLVLGTAVSGLMAKPMLVTLPLTLLLIDYWPLGRARRPSRDSGPSPNGKAWPRLAAEKVPLLLAAVPVGILAIFDQWSSRSIGSLSEYPLAARLGNAAVSLASYLRKALIPSDLAAMYLHTRTLTEPWWAAACAAAVAVATVLAIRHRPRRPYLLAGWLWYLVTILPVGGVIQVGFHAMADRYTYVPLVGIFLAGVFGVSDTGLARRRPALVPAVLGAATVALAAAAAVQVGYWRNDLTLWEHAVRVTKDNWYARNNLALALMTRGRTAEALSQLREAERVNPGEAQVHNNLGILLSSPGIRRLDEAVGHFVTALRLDPTLLPARENLGRALLEMGLVSEATEELRRVIAARPGHPRSLILSGFLLERSGQLEEAAAFYRRAVDSWPENAEARSALGKALSRMGRREEAVRELRAAAELRPTDWLLRYDLGVALDGAGRPREAIDAYRRAVELKHDFLEARFNLAVDLLAVGDDTAAREQRAAISALDPSLAKRLDGATPQR